MIEKYLYYASIAGWYLLQIAIPIIILIFLKIPRQIAIRALIAISITWITNILYTAYVYNPAGIAYGIATGMDSPGMKYDNNTTAIALMTGWLTPTYIAGIFIFGHIIKKRVKSPKNSTATS